MLIFASMSKTVALHTLGCKLNFSETSTIGRLLENDGFIKKKFDEVADVYVINTCSVTDNADKECKAHSTKSARGYGGDYWLLCSTKT